MKKIKVCVVDDDAAYTYLVKMVVNAIGGDIDIMTFTDGDLAFDFMSAHAGDTDALPDMIFLDINMPRMNGWGFLKAYGNIATTIGKQIPIYMLSSSIADGDRAKALNEPLVSDYIVKPLEESRFSEILNTFSEKKSA